MSVNLLLNLGIYLLAVVIVLRAGLCGYGKTLRYRHTKACHFCQVSALAAEQVTHTGIAFTK